MLRRMVRLFAVALLVGLGSFVAVANPAGAETPTGIEYKSLAALCDYYHGDLVEGDRLPPYSYGCRVPDGDIGCLETTACFFSPIEPVPPFQQTCERIGARWFTDDRAGIFVCDTEGYDVVVTECTIIRDFVVVCDLKTKADNEPPMPLSDDR